MGVALAILAPPPAAAQKTPTDDSRGLPSAASALRLRMEGGHAQAVAWAYGSRAELYVRAADLVRLGLVRDLPGSIPDGDSLVPVLRLPGITLVEFTPGEALIARRDPLPMPALAPPTTRQVQLMVNNTPLGQLMVIEFGGQRYVSRDALRRLGIMLPPGRQRAISMGELRSVVQRVHDEGGWLRIWTRAPEPTLKLAEPPPAQGTPAPVADAGAPVASAIATPPQAPLARRPAASGLAALTPQTGRRAFRPPARPQQPARDLPALPAPGSPVAAPPPVFGAATGADGPGILAVLLVRINGGPSRFILRVRRLEGRVLVRRTDLRELRIRPPAGEGEISLDDIPGLVWRILEDEQVLELTVPEELLEAQRLRLSERERRPVDRAAYGAIVNYDLEVQQRLDGSAGPRTAAFGFLGLNAFSPYGSLTATALARTTGAGPRGDGQVVRLNTTFQYDDVDRAWSWRLGDVLTGSQDGGRRIRLGGLQWASEALLRPDLLNFARPFISGSAAAPSTLDLIVNGVRTYSTPVGAGPFELRDIPVMVGANSVRLTLRDAQGLTTTRVIDIFSSRRLLAQGTTEHSVELGAIRRGFGFRSFDYGRLAASGFVRHGVSEKVTVGARAEGTTAGGLAGAAGTLSLGRFGTISVEPATSFGPAGEGTEIAGRWEVSGQRYSLGVGASQAFGAFKDLAGQAGAPTRRRSLSVSGGLSLGDLGFLGATYLEQKLDGAPQQRIVLGSLFRTFADNITGGLTGFADMNNGARGVMAYLSFPLGGDVRGAVSGGLDRGDPIGRASVERPTPFGGGYGWRVATQEGRTPLRQAELRHAGVAAEMEVGVQAVGTDTAARARVSGAVVALDGLHARRSIPGSVASVHVGLPGVQVMHENRPAGVTGESGRLLITGLQPHEANRISVNPVDLPFDTRIDSPTLLVVPPRDAGVRARFSTTSTMAVLLRLVRDDGSVPAQNAEARDAEGRTLGTVGLDGELFLTDVRERFPLLIIENGRQCRVEVQVPQERRGVTTLPATCVAP